MEKIASISVFALSLGLAFSSIGSVQADEAWQKKAGVGSYASDNQDWSAIEAAARCGGDWVLPDFTGLPRGPKDTDFNDLKQLQAVNHG